MNEYVGGGEWNDKEAWEEEKTITNRNKRRRYISCQKRWRGGRRMEEEKKENYGRKRKSRTKVQQNKK